MIVDYLYVIARCNHYSFQFLDSFNTFRIAEVVVGETVGDKKVIFQFSL